MSGAKILVVEDEIIMAMELQKKLESWGYDSITATFGEEAIKKAFKLKPDLILMDILLKGEINGIEASQQISRLFDIPVIYLTAHSSQRILERVKVTEPYAYLIKPFGERELQINVEIALYRHKAKKKMVTRTRRETIADLYIFIGSLVPLLASYISSEDRESLLMAFAKRFENNMKLKFDREVGTLLYDSDDVLEDPNIPLNAYMSWVSSMFSDFGFRNETVSEDSKKCLKVLECPWMDEIEETDIFCHICQTMIEETLIWTGFEGNVKHKSDIMGIPPVCEFEFYFKSPHRIRT